MTQKLPSKQLQGLKGGGVQNNRTSTEGDKFSLSIKTSFLNCNHSLLGHFSGLKEFSSVFAGALGPTVVLERVKANVI